MVKRTISEKQRRIYMRRRIVAVLVLLVLIALIAWGVTAGIHALQGRGANKAGPAHSASASATPSKSSPAAKNTEKADAHKGKVPNCGPEDVDLVLTAPEPTTSVGGYVEFTASIRYKGSRSCMIDASDNSRVLVITSGERNIWRSDSCPVDARQLLMASGDHDDQPMRWNADATGDQCQADSALPRVNPGSYQAQLILKSNPQIKSQPVPLIVE